jgi:hypothetical protein
MTVALFFYCLVHEKWIWAGISLGCVLAAKQYAIFIPIFVGIWLVRNQFDARRARGFIFACTVTALALYLPFFLADSKAFYYGLVTSLLEQPRRPDAFTIVSVLQKEFEITFSGAAILWTYGLALVLLALALIARKTLSLRLCVGSLVILYGFVFLFGKQAFCNYYQFLAFLTAIYLTLGEAPDRTQ